MVSPITQQILQDIEKNPQNYNVIKDGAGNIVSATTKPESFTSGRGETINFVRKEISFHDTGEVKKVMQREIGSRKGSPVSYERLIDEYWPSGERKLYLEQGFKKGRTYQKTRREYNQGVITKTDIGKTQYERMQYEGKLPPKKERLPAQELGPPIRTKKEILVYQRIPGQPPPSYPGVSMQKESLTGLTTVSFSPTVSERIEQAKDIAVDFLTPTMIKPLKKIKEVAEPIEEKYITPKVKDFFAPSLSKTETEIKELKKLQQELINKPNKTRFEKEMLKTVTSQIKTKEYLTIPSTELGIEGLGKPITVGAPFVAEQYAFGFGTGFLFRGAAKIGTSSKVGRYLLGTKPGQYARKIVKGGLITTFVGSETITVIEAETPQEKGKEILKIPAKLWLFGKGAAAEESILGSAAARRRIGAPFEEIGFEEEAQTLSKAKSELLRGLKEIGKIFKGEKVPGVELTKLEDIQASTLTKKETEEAIKTIREAGEKGGVTLFGSQVAKPKEKIPKDIDVEADTMKSLGILKKGKEKIKDIKKPGTLEEFPFIEILIEVEGEKGVFRISPTEQLQRKVSGALGFLKGEQPRRKKDVEAAIKLAEAIIEAKEKEMFKTSKVTVKEGKKFKKVPEEKLEELPFEVPKEFKPSRKFKKAKSELNKLIETKEKVIREIKIKEVKPKKSKTSIIETSKIPKKRGVISGIPFGKPKPSKIPSEIALSKVPHSKIKPSKQPSSIIPSETGKKKRSIYTTEKRRTTSYPGGYLTESSKIFQRSKGKYGFFDLPPYKPPSEKPPGISKYDLFKEKKKKKKKVKQPRKLTPTGRAALTRDIFKPTKAGVFTGLGERGITRKELKTSPKSAFKKLLRG